jgi:DNA mismatch repair protein MutS
LQVAALAGIPGAVIEQARRHLDVLEREQRLQSPQLGLFDPGEPARPAAAAPGPAERIRDRLAQVEPDGLSPRDALELLYELKALQRAAEED